MHSSSKIDKIPIGCKHVRTNANLENHRRRRRRRRVAGEGRRVVAPPCPRSTARLQSSPIGRVESFRTWSSHLFRGRPDGRRHVRSGGWKMPTQNATVL